MLEEKDMDNQLSQYANLSWLPNRYSDLNTDLVIVITETVGGKRDSYELTEMLSWLEVMASVGFLSQEATAHWSFAVVVFIPK